MAAALNSTTLHSLFSLSKKSSSWEELAKLDIIPSVLEKFRNIEFLAIDEYSLLSGAWFHYILITLEKITALLARKRQFNIIILGELWQLPSVFGAPLYCFPENVGNHFAKKGVELYKKFSPVFYLEGSERTKDLELSELLHNLRRKQVSDRNIELLQSRRKENLTREELCRFNSAVAIFSTNAEANKFNNFKLKQLGTPILELKSKVTPSNFQYYYQTESVKVAVGCELFLTSNINTTIGLYSGATCKFVSPYNTRVYKDLEFPDCILLEFPNISSASKIVPIFPCEDIFYCCQSGKKISVKYWPIRLKYGLTSFKSQGLTIPRLILKLDKSEPYSNSTYTSLSRVKSLKDVCIVSAPLTKERFSNHSFCAWEAELKEEATRMGIYNKIYNSFESK